MSGLFGVKTHSFSQNSPGAPTPGGGLVSAARELADKAFNSPLFARLACNEAPGPP